jgi:glyoxylase-like metal-dependent hydrolase (beta-lactamase superfamily II)
MRDIRRIGRRTWLARTAGGLLAVWAGLEFGFGRRGWGIALGRGRGAIAQAQEPVGTEPHRVILGQNGFVSAYVMVRGNEAVLVDTGVAGSAAAIGEVVQHAGLGWDAVQHVILTHYHSDHAGSVGDVLGLASQAAVYAGGADIPRINAPREIAPVVDGQEVFGLQIIATPGHTPGHISVFDPIGSTLVTGDAVVNFGGRLASSPPQFTADVAQAAESVRKMAGLSFERLLFMHGEPIESGGSTELAKLAASLWRPQPPGQSRRRRAMHDGRPSEHSLGDQAPQPDAITQGHIKQLRRCSLA